MALSGGAPKTGLPASIQILGVGRLIKLNAQNEAEVAILVSDQYQKQGLGIEVLRRTVQIARDEKLAPASPLKCCGTT